MPSVIQPSTTSAQSIDTGLPQSVCLYAPVTDTSHLLSEGEAAIVANAAPKRRGEFATGRRLAREALQQLGQASCDILTGSRRQPLWPAGTVGSIAHSHTDAVALVSANRDLRGIGIDLEEADRLRPQLLPRILTKAEQARLGPLDPTLVFSAKEAVYKLLYPLFGEYLGFQAVEIEFDTARGLFAARYLGDLPALHCLSSARGYYRKMGQHWLTVISLDSAGE